MRMIWPLALALVAAVPAAAQRALPVPPDKGWQHAASGIVLTARLAGLPRTTLDDLSDAEDDVVAEFASLDRATIATVYIFHPAMMSVPVWFDRAQTALELKKVYGGVDASGIAPAAFTPPGASVATGLRQTYRPHSGPYRGTALAVAPVGEWLVAVRVSSTTLPPALIDAELTEVLTAIRWPATGGGAVAVPVAPCADHLAFTKAKVKRADLSQTLLGSLLAGVPGDATEGKPQPPFCREEVDPNVIYGVYRRSGTHDGYTLAIADSGRIAGVYPAATIPGIGDGRGGYQVSMTALDGSVATYPLFDTLPQPDQVATLVLRGTPSSRTTTKDGKTNVFIDSKTK